MSFDLERLSLVSWCASRYLRTLPSHTAKRRTRRSPTRDRPKNVSCFRSLHDVSILPRSSIGQEGSSHDEPANRIVDLASAYRASRCSRPISLWPTRFALLEAERDWWVEKELNLRPHAYQACALTT